LKAAVLHDLNQPLTIEDVPDPVPGRGEVIIKVVAAGVCHTDVHLADNHWPQIQHLIKRPVILGHESVGYVAAIGSGVENVREGDRVGVPWVHWTCGACEYCTTERENLCPHQLITGATVDGGYAEYLCARASHVARIPESLSLEEAGPLLCAGLTVYKALKVSGARVSQRVAIFGIGGLGHLAVQVAKWMETEVIAVDISDEKTQLAQACGADVVINALENNATEQIQALGGAHVAIVTSAAKASYDAAFHCLKHGGTLVVAGIPAEDVTFSPILMVAGEIKIVSSAGGTRQDLSEILDLASAGKVKCRIQPRPLEDVNQVFQQLRSAKVLGRVVLRI